jgi:site-specific DNA-methyltransferase (adenine-specific)
MDGITIYHGDCLDVLAALPECLRVDTLLTDPPYGIGFGQYASHDDSPAEYFNLIWPAINAAEARVNRGGIAAVFQSDANAPRWGEILRGRQFRVFVGCKTFGQVGREFLMRSTDFVLYWRIGGWENWSRSDWESVVRWQIPKARNWFISTDSSRTQKRWPHPCPRPLDMMRHLVAILCPPRSIVLDPFMGSGTTLVAAKQLGRRAIGIELEESYCAMAVERLAQTVMRYDTLPEERPKQVELAIHTAETQG